jgi:hypothetical protein
MNLLKVMRVHLEFLVKYDTVVVTVVLSLLLVVVVLQLLPLLLVVLQAVTVEEEMVTRSLQCRLNDLYRTYHPVRFNRGLKGILTFNIM